MHGAAPAASCGTRAHTGARTCFHDGQTEDVAPHEALGGGDKVREEAEEVRVSDALTVALMRAGGAQSPGTFNGGAQSVWLAAMRNFDIQAHTIGVFAVCANRPAGYQVVRKDTSVPGGGFLRTTADCPAGTVVNGGGARVIGAGESNFGTRMQESAPGITGVPSVSVHMAAVRNGATARTIGVHAVCSRAPAGYEVVRRNVTTG